VTGGTATPVQRAGSGGGDAVPRGVPAAEAAPAPGRPRSASATPPAAGKGADRRAEPPQDPGLDLDDLARRLLDPVARLLRTELRRGRERDGRR
jgi:syndecan 1